MSNISRTHIYYPLSVACEIKNHNNQHTLWVSGEYGTWFYRLSTNNKYKITIYNNYIHLKTIKFYSVIKHYFCALKYSVPGLSSHLSLLTVLLKRMIVGAGAGFKRFLRVRGVGYKFELQQTLLKVNVGFTHVLTKNVPSEFVVKFSRKFKVIRFRSKSLNMLTGILSALHALRKPDAYKGKGIRYKGEITHLKPGKDRKKGLSKKKKI